MACKFFYGSRRKGHELYTEKCKRCNRDWEAHYGKMPPKASKTPAKAPHSLSLAQVPLPA